MQAYEKYNIGELATDDFFLESCLNPTAETETFWKEWIKINPEKSEMWHEAKKIIISLAEGRKNYALVSMPQEKVDLLWHKIHTTISQNNETTILKGWNWRSISKWAVAASVLIIMSLGIFYVAQKPQKPFQANSVTNFIKLAKESLHEEINESNISRKITLSDGSVITLSPKSGIQYADNFNINRRDVYMQGEAFFDVAHDVKRPFFVITDDIVTKVLGTKFLVSSNDKSTNISVQAGKVSVVKRAEIDKISPNVMVLLPNQQVNYSVKSEIISKSIIDKPVLLYKNTNTKSFEFDDIPISKVFNDLEKAYGIHIVYLGDNFSNCTLTASLTNQSFFTKIDMICEILNAQYEVLDGQVFITGAGCK